jgi:hypothetical protein
MSPVGDVLNVGIYEGLQEPTRNDIVAVGLASVRVSEARQGLLPRKEIIIRNTSPNAIDIITVNVGYNVATANAGIVLKQYETLVLDTTSVAACPQTTITAICATVNGQLSVYER